MKLTLGEIAVLFEELNGRMNRETGERTKGILSHKLSIRAKYILNNELNKKLSEEMKHYEEARLEIFKELGKQEGENISVSPYHYNNQQVTSLLYHLKRSLLG